MFRIFISLTCILFLTGFFSDTSNLPSCTQSDCNCSDFATQAASQTVLDSFPGDPYRLDHDGNGLACESLPRSESKSSLSKTVTSSNINSKSSLSKTVTSFKINLKSLLSKTITSSNINLKFGNPSKASQNDLNNYLIEKPQYVLSYNCQIGTANWVSWEVDSSWFGNVERSNDFRPDPDVPCYAARPSDYRRTGYDRGHLNPSGDRTVTEIDNSATFFMSNMIPQSPANNREIWRELEQYSRDLVQQGKELYIVAGVEGNQETIAKGHIVVPEYIWKVILITGNNNLETLAVRVPNSQKVARTNWTDYIVTVDEIEQNTSYDFFSNLKQDIQNKIEAQAYKST